MTLAFSPGTDFEDICDGLEAVTLERRDSTTEVSIANALQREVTYREVEISNGRYQLGDVLWRFPQVECPTRPVLGDKIKDGNSDRWTILDVRDSTLRMSWRCVTRNLTVVHHLNDTITIEKYDVSKGTAGAPERTFYVWRAGIPARIQPISATPGETAGAHKTDRRYEIYCAEDLDIDRRCRVKDQKGNTYRVQQVTGREDIAGLMTIGASLWL